MEITSLTNAKVKQWAKYKEKKYREQDRKFLIEGEHLIEEAHKAGLIETIIIEQGRTPFLREYQTYEVTPEILLKLCGSVSGTHIVAICHYPQQESVVGGNWILLDDVQDPGNVGTIIRTAHSFGYEGIVLSNHSVDVYNEKVIRSTQGALFHIAIQRAPLVDIIKTLKQKGISIYATALRDAHPLSSISFQKPCVFVFGNEGNGVSDEVLAICDEKVFIEMDTFESLNVAVAAGICLYEGKIRR